MNSGTLRNDTIIKSGQLTYSTVSNIINDVLVVKEVSGSIILEMLEYSVFNLPTLSPEASFSFPESNTPMIIGKTPGSNLLKLEGFHSISIACTLLLTFSYSSGGGDGFSMIRNCKYIVDPSRGNRFASSPTPILQGIGEWF